DLPSICREAVESDMVSEAGRALEERLVELQIAGPEGSHTRATNLEAIQRLLRGDPYLTFGVEVVCQEITWGRLDEALVLQQIARFTGCSVDTKKSGGQGFIEPAATITGLRKASRVIVEAAQKGGTFVVGTAHPGSLLGFGIDLVRLVKDLGGRVIDDISPPVQQENLALDVVGGVVVLSDTCGALHTHDSELMTRFLSSHQGQVDLAILDHGFAGAAINLGLPTIAVMDTNDPAIAMAKHLGANVTIIPMNDNRPNYVLREAARIMERMIRGEL
ncbi:MAG: phosphatase, partial [Chloroflexi bacterium]|nr:phosphatase [Chloroflexota bacterium]